MAEAQQLSLRTFEALECEGMARVDLFLGKDRSCGVNEIKHHPRLHADFDVPEADASQRRPAARAREPLDRRSAGARQAQTQPENEHLT